MSEREPQIGDRVRFLRETPLKGVIGVLKSLSPGRILGLEYCVDFGESCPTYWLPRDAFEVVP